MASFLSKLFGVKTPKEPEIYYSMNFKTDGVRLTLKVNGETVISEDYEFQGCGCRSLNPWTKPGTNLLTVNLEPLKDEDYGMRCNILFSRDQPGMMAGDGEALWDFAWDSQSGEKLPREWQQEFTI